jgi:hypothetical protein
MQKKCYTVKIQKLGLSCNRMAISCTQFVSSFQMVGTNLFPVWFSNGPTSLDGFVCKIDSKDYFL